MTTISHSRSVLPLDAWPGRTRLWVFVLGFGLPLVIGAAALIGAELSGQPTHGVGFAIAILFATAVLGALILGRIVRRVDVALDGDTLVANAGVTTQRFPLATLRRHGLDIVDLDTHIELKPMLRTYGIGMPGLAGGWFRLRNRDKAFCVLTSRHRVSALQADDGTRVLLSLADPAPLRDALASR
jgi:MFS family permease